jgi:hypothetical protein
MSDISLSPSLTQSLAEGVSSRALSLAFGATQNVEGADLVPVALVTYGFGASDASPQWGSGGGGGGVVVPLGVYVKGRNGLRFRANPIVVLTVVVPPLTMAGWLLAKWRVAGAR